ncbi:MAG: HD domain-containing protein [Nanoarchaeota archaeon]
MSEPILDLDKLRKFYQLKNVTRMNSVMDRKESPAEHTWSALVLADYLLSKVDFKVDRLRVYELLLYHDLAEIDVGDTPLYPENKNEHPDELAAVKNMDLPDHMKQKVVDLFTEYEERKTIEARFAQAMDKLDAEVHELDYKEDWKGWTEVFLREKKEKYLQDFPELVDFFEELIVFQKENGFFDQ